MKELTTIQLFRGATSEVEFDLSDFNFEINSELLFTIKQRNSNRVVLQKRFTESKKYNVIFTDEFTATLYKNEYVYDIMYLINDERYPQCLPSRIVVSEVVGGYESSN